MSISAPALVADMSERVYHSDPVAAGSLSSTGAKEILRSPAHYRQYVDGPRESKAAFDLGSAIHTLTLGTGWPIQRVEADSWRTKEAREAKASAESAGALALLDKDYAIAESVARSVRTHPIIGKLLDGEGQAEVSAFGKTDSGTWLRGRYDYVTPSGIIVDLKSIRSADPNDFARTAWAMGYDVQAAHYMETYRLATGRAPRGFIHVLAEKEPPYAVSVVQLDGEFLALGESKLRRAIARYEHCTSTGEWPAYPGGIVAIEPHMWMTYAEEEAEEREG